MMKYEYVTNDIPWIAEYPNHWKVYRIKERVENVVGGEWGGDPDSEDNDGSRKIVVLRVADFDGIYLRYENITIRRVKESKIPNRLINGNCLIMEKSGGGEKQLVGRVAEARDLPFEAITSNFIAKIEFDSKVNAHFMNYLLHDLYNSNLNFPFVQQTTGIQNINSTYYLYTKVPFPPKPEQIAIANYLDKACADIDRVVEIKRKQIENLKQQLKSIIHHTITKGLNPDVEMKESGIDWIGHIPKHWKVEIIKRRMKFEYGSALKEEDRVKGNYHVYGSNGIVGSNNYAISENETIIIGRKGSAGAVNYSHQSCFPIDTTFFIDKNFTKEDIRFLYYLLKELGLQSLNIDTAVPGLSRESAYREKLPYPPKSEQKDISKYLDEIHLKIETLENNVSKQIEVLLNYKKSLIHEVVTGKKQVWDLIQDK